MQMTYADRFVVGGKDAEERCEQLRQKALELITMFPGNWQSDRIVHWCHGCCADRAQAVFTVFTLVHGIIVEHAMGTVVVSQWMPWMPAVQHIPCMAFFHCLRMHVESAGNGRMKKPAADHIAADVVTPDLQEIRKAWSRRAAVSIYAKSTHMV